MNYTLIEDGGLYKNIHFGDHIVRYNLGGTPFNCYIELYHTAEERIRSIILVIELIDNSNYFTI